MLRNTLNTLETTSPDLTTARKVRALEKRRRAEPRRFALFDQQPLRGECLASWLRATSSRCEVSTFLQINALLNCVEADSELDLLLFSVCETAFPQVLDALDRIGSMSLSIPSIVISSEEHPGAALEFLRRGARGFIPTSLDVVGASKALDFVAAGGTFLPAPLFLEADLAGVQRSPRGGLTVATLDDGQKSGEARGAVAELTSREAKVLECLCRGKPNKLIAHELGLCESTVKMYLGRLMRKAKVTNRTELALFRERLLRETTSLSTERAADALPISASA
jgi:DNA-binding NarL/FixJ family response regulator